MFDKSWTKRSCKLPQETCDSYWYRFNSQRTEIADPLHSPSHLTEGSSGPHPRLPMVQTPRDQNPPPGQLMPAPQVVLATKAFLFLIFPSPFPVYVVPSLFSSLLFFSPSPVVFSPCPVFLACPRNCVRVFWTLSLTKDSICSRCR